MANKIKRTYPQLPNIKDQPTKESLRLLWDAVHGHTDFINDLDERHLSLRSTVTSQQTTLDRTVKTVTNIAASKGTDEAAALPTGSGVGGGSSGGPPSGGGTPGSGGGGSGGGPPLCSQNTLNGSLPSWFSSALISAGQDPSSNCLNESLLAVIEGTLNANDYTPQRNSGCATRARLYHQANHGLWGTFCGQGDASAVADFYIDVSITYSDGSKGWGWV